MSEKIESDTSALSKKTPKKPVPRSKKTAPKKTPENLEKLENSKNSEVVGTSEKSENPKNTKNIKNIKNTGSVKNIKNIKNVKNAEKSENSENAKKTPEKPKRSVGRPKKKINRKLIKVEGVVDKPSNHDSNESGLVYSIEVLYGNPIMFKNMFMLLKHVKVYEVIAKFEKDKLVLYSADPLSRTSILMTIYGDKMNRYYCEKPIQVKFSTENWLNRLKTLSKENTEIHINTVRSEERHYLYMVLKDDTIGIVYEDKIPVLEDNSDFSEVESQLAGEEHYPVKFELPAKKLKEIITNINQQVDKFEISIVGGGDLVLKYDYQDQPDGGHEATFKQPDKISLKTNLKEGYCFSVFVDSARIKLISGIVISEDVHISVEEKKNLVFTIYLDQEYNEEKKIIEKSECACIKVVMVPIEIEKKM